MQISVSYYTLIILASIISGAGLLTNNVAVVIGSMLISPFGEPIQNIATGSRSEVVSAILEIIFGSVVAILTGYIIGSFYEKYNKSPIEETPEMISRIHWKSHTYLNVLIAAIAGLIAVIANRTMNISIIIGVAMAISILPAFVDGGLYLSKGAKEDACESITLAVVNILTFAITYILGWNILKND